jgi:hypothetical protein
LIVLAVTTNFRQDHAGVFWVASASVGITTGLRVFIKIYGERLGSRRQLRFLIAATVVLSSVTSGYVYSATLWFYGFENWTFIVTMLCLVGFASGGTISFTPDSGLLRIYVSFILGPALGAWGYIVAGQRATPLRWPPSSSAHS